MNGEKFDPKDVEEILSRRPSSGSYKIKKSDLPEIAKSIGIGAIEIVKALPSLALSIMSVSTKNPSPTEEGYRDGHEGYGYYDETGLRNRAFEMEQSDNK